jgi:hypothetical protein
LTSRAQRATRKIDEKIERETGTSNEDMQRQRKSVERLDLGAEIKGQPATETQAAAPSRDWNRDLKAGNRAGQTHRWKINKASKKKNKSGAQRADRPARWVTRRKKRPDLTGGLTAAT